MVGKVALVTGGGSGLGRATAVAFAERGANVLVADVDDAAARRYASTRSRPRAARPCSSRTDVTAREPVEAHRRGRASTRFGRLDYAVNNAGTTGRAAFTADYAVDDWHRTITLNLDERVLLPRQEIPVMLAGRARARS